MNRSVLKIAALIAAICLAGGCTPGPRKAAAVNPEQARSALKSALDAWKEGKSLESLKSASPAIVAGDIDWMQGKKLTSYEVLGDGTPQDANLRVEVKLTFEGSAEPKKAIYIVGTDPQITVFRALE